MWRVLSSKKIFDHPRLTLTEDTIELPNGKVTTYLKFSGEPDAVTVICRNQDNKFLVQKEYSHPTKQVLWQFPGGKVEKNENILNSANRELQEESGLKARKLTPLGKYLINNRRSDSYMHVVLADDCFESKFPADSEEQIENYWVTREEINQLIRSGKILNVHILASLELLKNNPNSK